jgi:prepilin-type N-terminal cleavage/methylation domain-containing protein
MRKNGGFTLIELMIVLALFAIIASVAFPTFLSQRSETKLRDAVSMIRGDLEMARSRAIRENALVAILIRADGYTIFVDNGSGGGIAENWVRDGEEQQLCSRALPEGVSIDLSNVTFDSTRTRFNGRGYSENSGAMVIADSEGKSTTLDMNNRFGRITTY